MDREQTARPRRSVFAWLPDGTVRRVSPEAGTYVQPSIHPAGTEVVFWGGRLRDGEAPRVWTASVGAAGDAVPLTPAGTEAFHPAFGWDGRSIAFAMATGALPPRDPGAPERLWFSGLPAERRINLFVMRADGGGLRPLTHGPFVDERPSFSPNGATVVFVSDRGGAQQLWTVPVDGREEPRPLRHAGWAYRPWFAADGGSIFFFADRGGRRGICRIPAAGGPVQPLANDDQGNSHGPFADLDGKTLLMHSDRGGEWGIWELPLDGRPPRRLRPPGYERAGHATRGSNQVITFDSTM